MAISQFAVRMIKSFEGCRLTPYKDSAGLWTIGYGHLLSSDPNLSADSATVKSGITQAMAEEFLIEDLTRTEAAVSRILAMRIALQSYQREALVSFAFNLGPGRLEGSTLLTFLLTGNPLMAAWEFEKWCHAGGKPNPGLLRRRLAEQAWFLGGSEGLVRYVWEGRI
jgi:lysozyme